MKEQKNALDDEKFLTRWKRGIQQITPYQQARITYRNNYLMLIGIAAGFVASLYSLEQLWWLSIVLLAAFVNTVITQIGAWQKYKLLKQFEENVFVGVEKDVENVVG